jgi:hypothetical protein
VVSSPTRSADDGILRRTSPSPIDVLEELGVAVFPQRQGQKGTWVRGWPTVSLADALLERLAARGRINLAARAGNGIAVLDLDGKDGREPDRQLPDVLSKLGDAVIGVVSTARGFHVWLAVRESVGNGYCSALGGDVFSEPHLAMLPPSLHPNGHRYEWVTELREASDRADLRGLGYVPDEPTFHAGLPRDLTPATLDVQHQFAALMGGLRVAQGRRNQELVRCPWHDDHEPSLSINWSAALFHCFGEECLVGGGIGTLRRMLGRDTPSYRQGAAAAIVGKSGCVQDEIERLATTLVALGHDEKAGRLRECKATFAVAECGPCGIRPVYPLSCGQPFCPSCMTGRLASAWKAHAAVLPESLTLLRLQPRDLWGVDQRVFKKVRSRFSEWRERAGILGGLYGVRLRWGHGAEVLLALPADQPVPQSSRAFEVDVVAEGCSQDDCLRWLQSEYADEAAGWETDQDLVFLLDQTTRRRRFQGFGEFYQSASVLPADESGPDDHEEPATTLVQLSRVSGGAGSKAKDVPLCPKCGGAVRMLGFTVRKDDVQVIDGVLQWVGSLPGQKGAAA